MRSLVMKNVISIPKRWCIAFRILVIIVFATQLMQCSHEEKPLEAEHVKQLLTSNTWKLQSATVDGVDRTSLYADLLLDFSDAHYTAQGNSVWLPSGTWSFSDDTGKTMILDGNIEITVREITEHKLVLSFISMVRTLKPGRLSSTSGEYTLTFTK